jgi:hypothetical protein
LAGFNFALLATGVVDHLQYRIFVRFHWLLCRFKYEFLLYIVQPDCAEEPRCVEHQSGMWNQAQVK